MSEVHKIEHDGFEGTVIGSYVTREGKRGVVLQQVGTKVVHVYGEKWFPTLPTSKEAEAVTEDDPVCTDCGGTGITYQTERRCACQPREWRYGSMYGPDGETSYAWVYSDKGEMVCTTKLHHAIAIVDRFNALTAPAGDGVPGMVLVPRECTLEMEQAFFDENAKATEIFADVSDLWRAMVDASTAGEPK